MPALNSAEVAQLAVEVASEKLAEDIVMLDLRGLAPFTDYFVIMSGNSARQLEALEEDLTDALKEAGVRRFHPGGHPGVGLDTAGLQRHHRPHLRAGGAGIF